MSSETLGFLDFKCDFLANKTSDKNIFRVSNSHRNLLNFNFSAKNDYVSFDL